MHNKALDKEQILEEYRKKLPEIILKHYHIFISTYILVLAAFCFTDFYFREIPALSLTRIAPIVLGIILLIIKFTKLKNKRDLVIIVNNLFCISLFMMIFIILIITFDTWIFKSTLTAIITVTVSIYFLVKGTKSIILVFSIPLLFITVYLLLILKPASEQMQELMNPLAIYIGIFFVSLMNEKSRIKEFGLIKNLEYEQDKKQKLLKEKLDQNELLITQKQDIEKNRNLLKELNANKDRFFSIIAHDLKGPIAGFLSQSEYLTENYEAFDEKERIKLVSLMSSSSKRLYDLLENLLEWSKLQINNISFKPKRFDIKIITSNVLDILNDQIRLKKLDINIDIDPQSYVFADQNMIFSILKNLIENAIKFSYQGKSITISCKIKNSYAQISVTDEGVGLTEADRNKLFKIETVITNEGTMNEKGSGLGLILCKEFIEKNGGKIWVESELNEGTTFVFTLPIESAA